MATKKITKPAPTPTAASSDVPPAPPPSTTAGGNVASGTLASAITDLGDARKLPACSGWAHEYADPVHAERTIQQFLEEDGTLMRIVECDGVLAKAPVQPAEEA